MDILPAIDIRNGKVVRLAQGDYGRQTTYFDDPEAVAAKFIELGVRWIHIVDLDAARSGKRTNARLVRNVSKMAARSGVKTQYGGGIRNLRAIDALLAEGVDRLVIASAALKNWKWFQGLLEDKHCPNQCLALGLDARNGYVAAEGWTKQLDKLAVDLAAQMRGSGLGAIVYTDITRDGMLTGVNFEATEEVIAATDVPIIASGGIASFDDIRRCKEIGCAGLIVGRAYYEGKIDLPEALEISAQ